MPRWEFSSHPATGTTMEPQALQKLELLQKERHWADFEYNLWSRGESYHWPSLTIIDMSCWFTSLGCHFCYVELVLTAYSGVCCCELCLGQDFPSVGGAYSVYISDIAMSVAWWFQFASIFWLVISYVWAQMRLHYIVFMPWKSGKTVGLNWQTYLVAGPKHPDMISCCHVLCRYGSISWMA